MRVRLNTDIEIGLPLEAYIINERLAIESGTLLEEKERFKAYICRKQNITLLKLLYKEDAQSVKLKNDCYMQSKSGVRKTTTTVNLGVDSAMQGNSDIIYAKILANRNRMCYICFDIRKDAADLGGSRRL